jgi:hypothetical protein
MLTCLTRPSPTCLPGAVKHINGGRLTRANGSVADGFAAQEQSRGPERIIEHREWVGLCLDTITEVCLREKDDLLAQGVDRLLRVEQRGTQRVQRGRAQVHVRRNVCEQLLLRRVRCAAVRVERGAWGTGQLAVVVSMVSMIDVLADLQRRLEGVCAFDVGMLRLLVMRRRVRRVRLHRRPAGATVARLAKYFGKLAEAVDDILLLHAMDHLDNLRVIAFLEVEGAPVKAGERASGKHE